jgi:D-alanyl-D-alanine carboxypeptidase
MHDPIGYSVSGLGQPKPSQNMAAGWLSAAGGLGMSAEDLAKWDFALMEGRLLSPEEHKALGTEMLLNNGVGSRYALGLNVRMIGGRRMWMHDGGVPGFIANNIVLPDDGLAIVVFTNGDFMDVAGAIAGWLQRMLLATLQSPDNSRTPRGEHILKALQQGRLDRCQLTAHANAYFEEPVLGETSIVLRKAGAVKSFELISQTTLGGMQERHYSAVLEHQRYAITVRIDANGLVEQYTLSPE